jgi:hypothetical protein
VHSCTVWLLFPPFMMFGVANFIKDEKSKLLLHSRGVN